MEPTLCRVAGFELFSLPLQSELHFSRVQLNAPQRMPSKRDGLNVCAVILICTIHCVESKKLDVPGKRGARGDTSVDPEDTGRVIYILSGLRTPRDPSGKSWKTWQGRRTSWLPYLACCHHMDPDKQQTSGWMKTGEAAGGRQEEAMTAGFPSKFKWPFRTDMNTFASM